MLKKAGDLIVKIWKDPVGSALISASIIYLIGYISLRLTNSTLADAKVLVSKTLNKGVPLYIAILGAILPISVYLIVNYLNKRSNDSILKEIINEHYSFEELYDVLYNQFLPELTLEMKARNKALPLENLLINFYRTSVYLGNGITYNNPGPEIDGNYAWLKLYPKLLSYSLVKQSGNSLDPSATYASPITYNFSDQGLKFFQLLTKYFLKYPDELDKAEKHRYF